MTNEIKDKLKKLLKAVGLYNVTVYAYCRIESLYVKGKDILQYLHSPLANANFKKRNVADGLPFPPVRLVHFVTNTYRNEWFYETGVIGSQCIRRILDKNRIKIDAFASILDFGCGCGRIIRHWQTLHGPRIFGCDYNPVLVDWCKENLPFAEFMLNDLSARLIYEDEKFDFIYAISVFTHLTEAMGFFWMEELDRVLKPGGIMYLTFMGSTRASNLRIELQERFETGELVVIGCEHPGKNICAAFHPEKYVREILAKGFQILDFVPGGAKDANQDVFLLKKNDVS